MRDHLEQVREDSRPHRKRRVGSEMNS
jgi:hypothetical protein